MIDFVQLHKPSNLRSATITKAALLFSFVVGSMFSQSAYAACKNINCACYPSEFQLASPTTPPAANGQYPISLEADNVEAQGKSLVTLTGNAEVKQGRATIVADQVKYYRENDRVTASGNVEMISNKGDYLSSESIDVIAPTQIGTLMNTRFKLAKAMSSSGGIDTVQIDSRGNAKQVNLEGEGIVLLKRGRYTNCKEGNNSVMIRGSSFELDRNAGVGKARHATVRFKGVPIFYTPYISFPINDERKTGFLTPGFGNDEDSGNIFEFPWYWNIAKNQDLTLTPRYYTDRGLQVAAEYRHESQSSETLIYGEVLPDDDLFGDDRDLFTITHRQQFTDDLSGKINFNDVSDIDYFDDLRNDVRSFSATFVPQEASLRYSPKYFRVSALVKEYQIIDDIVSEVNQPYERLPSIRFSTRLPDGPWGIEYGVNASFNNFSSDFRIEGNRTAITPHLTVPFETIWGYIKPKVSIHHRNYSLDNIELAGLTDDNPSFTVPIFSVDAGIYFEKNTRWFGEGALQTLEPRIYYVYAPEEDQSDIPRFDTSQVSLNNFSGIYRENRFFGEDRVGDTNQVTFGLTSRIIDNESGSERLRASIGQLYLIDDLEENLGGNIIESGLGNLLAELKTSSKGGFTTKSFLQYDYDESEIRTARFELGYEPENDNRKRLSVGYFLSQRGDRKTDQVTLKVDWPITDRWSFFGSERFSIEDSESISTTLGLEYNSCCWKIRFVGQDRINNRDIEDKRQSFFVELELTSLGRVRTGL